jgi:DNA helicase HerA-like ATPase
MPGYQLEPDLPKGDVLAGDPASRGLDRLLVGKLVEAGQARKLSLDISGEQVIAILGKRGTGKSYTLGVMIEGLASGQGATPISELHTARSGLVLDIMDIFWTSAVELKPDGSPEIAKQYQRMHKAGYASQRLAIDIWIPAGFARPDIDPPGVSELRIQASDLGLDDWADLFGVDIYGEPRGMLIADVVARVSVDGYTRTTGEDISPREQYTFKDLLDCLDSAQDIISSYRDDTRRSVRQRMASYAALSLFDGEGTSLTSLLRPFRVSVLMLARVPDELKKVLVAVLLKRVLRERRDASFAQKRLDLDSRLKPDEKLKLSKFVDASIPRTWVLLDEAHVLAGVGEGSGAAEALIKYAKEGRNYGLSMAVATQQPSALDPRLTSQAETLIVHQLTAPADAAVATHNVRSPLPTKIKLGNSEATVEILLRRLGQGEMAFSCGNAPTLPRLCIAMVRPRISAHGGYEA